MITFTGDPIFIGSKQIFDNSTELLIDAIFRVDTSVVAIIYARVSGEIIYRYETAYESATVDAETLSETDTAAMFNEAVHLLEKTRLEGLNPTNTFTITL
jgi:hypothetical protein